jgi:hypothetical protein
MARATVLLALAGQVAGDEIRVKIEKYETAGCTGAITESKVETMTDAENGACELPDEDQATEAWNSKKSECSYFGGYSYNHYTSADCTGDTVDVLEGWCVMFPTAPCKPSWPEDGEFEDDTCYDMLTIGDKTYAQKTVVTGCPMPGWFIALLVFLVLGVVGGGAGAFMFIKKIGPFAEKVSRHANRAGNRPGRRAEYLPGPGLSY